MKRWALLFGLIGLGLAIALIVHEGWGGVMAALSLAGWGLLWASLFHIVPMTVNAYAWQFLLARHSRPGLARMTLVVWLREAVNGLLPVARIGGEVVSGRVLRLQGVPAPAAVGSIIVDMTVSMASQFVFTLVGLAVLAVYSTDLVIVGRVALGIAATVPIVIALLIIQKIGFFGLLYKLLTLLFGPKLAGWVGGSPPARPRHQGALPAARAHYPVLHLAERRLAAGHGGNLAGAVFLRPAGLVRRRTGDRSAGPGRRQRRLHRARRAGHPGGRLPAVRRGVWPDCRYRSGAGARPAGCATCCYSRRRC